MPQKASQNIEETLAVVRYAFGFRDVEFAKNSGRVDHGKGVFQRILLDKLDRHWGEIFDSIHVGSERVGTRQPSDASIRRWFSGESKPYPRSIQILVKLLNITLSEWRSSGGSKMHGAKYDPTIPNRFQFKPNDLMNSPRALADTLGVNFAEFDSWFLGKGDDELKQNKQGRFEKFSGFYFAYRLSLHDPNTVHKSVMMIRQAYDSNDLEIRTFGSNGQSWSGLLKPGRNALSGMLANKDEFEGTRVRGISLIYDVNDVSTLSGFTTSVSDRGGVQLANFRTLLARTTAINMETMRDIDDPVVYRKLSKYCEITDTSNLPSTSDLSQVRKFLSGQGFDSGSRSSANHESATAFVAKLPRPQHDFDRDTVKRLGQVSSSNADRH